MKAVRTISRKYYVRQSVSIFMICCMFFNLPVVLATPQGATQVGGTAVGGITVGDTTTVDMGNSNKAIINWNSIDTSSSQILQFLKAGGDFAVLNRVLSGNATQFDGSLFGNQGSIFIVNTHGIVFGPTAVIQARNFAASGLDMANQDFMNDIYKFSGGNGLVANYGNIAADKVALIGKQVFNAGTIQSRGGLVIMAAGDRVFLREQGSNVLVEVDGIKAPADHIDGVPDIASDVLNEGTIEAAAGNIVLAAGDVFSRAIENVGTLAASGGTISASAARVGQFGTVNVDAIQGSGGNVNLTATEVAVLGTDSITTANAGVNGDGGNIIVYSPDTAIFRDGAIVEAKGGSQSGNGGFFELSGHEYVEVEGQIDLTAANGGNGHFLIDPRNIKIVDGDADQQNGDMIDNIWEPKNWLFGYSKLGISKLNEYLGLGDVTLETDFGGLQTGWVIFDATSDVQNTTDNSLTVNAGDYIKFRTGSGIDFAGGGNVTLNAGSSIYIDAEIDLYSGTFAAYSGLDNAGWFDTGIGNILVNADIEAGNIILSAGAGLPGYSDSHVTVGDGITLTANRRTMGYLWNKHVISEGDITVEAHHDVTLGGAVKADGDLIVNADRHPAAGGEDHIFGGDILAKDTIDAGGSIDMYGNNITLEGDVTSKYDMTITADTSRDFNYEPGDMEGDVHAYGNLESTSGSIDIYAADDTIHLENDYVKASDNITLHNNTIADDGVLIKAGDDVRTYGKLTGKGDLTVEAGDNIQFGDDSGDYVVVEKSLVAKSGLDSSILYYLFPDGSKGSIEAAGDVTAGDMLLSAGAGIPGYSDSHVSVAGKLTTTNSDMIIEAHHNITLGDNVDSAGSIVLNADRHGDYGQPDHMKGGDVVVEGTVNADGTIDMYGNNIMLWNDVEAGSNIRLFGDTSSDFADPFPEGDVTARGDITSTGGNIEIYSSDDTTYLGGDLYAAGNIWLNNNTKLIGEDDQSIEAEGTLTAKGFVRKVTPGDMWLMGWGADDDGKSIDLRYVSKDWMDPAASTCLGNLWIVGQNNVQISGDLSTFGDGKWFSKPRFMDIAVPEIEYPGDSFYCRPTGGVAVASLDGKIYTEDGINNDTLNISIYGSSDHMSGLGIGDPYGESDARAAIVVLSSDDLKFGDDSELRAFGKYYDDGSVDDRYAIDFVYTPGTRIPAPDGPIRNEGDPFDLAIYVASIDGDVHVGASTSIMSCEKPIIVNAYKVDSLDIECLLIPKGAMVVDALTNVTFGQNFIDSLEIGDIGSRLELVSRVTEWLDDAIGRLPFADQFNLPSEYNYVLRGAGGFGEGAWVLENPVTPPLYQENGFDLGGCPALMQWFAQEVGVAKEDTQIYVANTFSLGTDIQPCDSCARLQNAARTLDDNARIAELARVINEFVTPAAPPTPEQMTLIAQAFADHAGDGTYYAAAGEYIDAMAQYVGILNTELGFSRGQATAFLTNNHAPATTDAAVTTFIEARLAAIGG